MHHHSKQKQNTILGAILDIAAATQGIDTQGVFSGIGSMSYSQGFENEADYVGIYVLALAGYDVSNVHQIWRKMTIQTGAGTKASFFSSHPSNPERYIRMQRAIEEVKEKQRAGKKLEPNFKA
jgi:predicted Zn-dependent protease